ncbi:MAG: hypothetical protein EBS19_12230 [Spirochaetia bacterium]|nr:hypothetical protein [Spirochaetia bacterium]
MKNNYLLLITFIILFTALQAQKYEKDISFKEKRVLDYKKETKFPDDWKLFYKGKDTDYVVFYDLDGQEVYFKYRRDHLDREAEKLIVGLFVGQAYRIKGSFFGLILNFDEKTKKNFHPPQIQKKEEISNENKFSPNNKPIYLLDSFESTSLDEVLK